MWHKDYDMQQQDAEIIKEMMNFCNRLIDMRKQDDEPAEKSRLHDFNYTPTDGEIDDACLSFRHDYGLIEDEETRNSIRFEAKEWLHAWRKTL